ncbi:MAG: hypothetical protein AUK36_01245 [Zetaproteobacteria bacterium CG2_30_59_37]|nr:MAG: hypothetical protein AUK36_01245 [Zetaproteobacteria bacterium CG2_30_59_37]
MRLDIEWLAKEIGINPLNEDKREALQTAFEFEFLNRNMPLIHQGTSLHDLYLLRSGSLRITRRNGSGDITLGFSNKNRTFGEISFFGDEPATASVIAETPSEVYKLSCEKYHWLMKNHADLAMKLMAYILRGMGEVIRDMNNSRH